MVKPIKLECQVLPGAPGWAACTVQSGETIVRIGPFSHALTEGIDDLVRAATAIVSERTEQIFSMDDEPEPIWKWSLKPKLARGPSREELEVTIQRFDDVMSEHGVEVFHATCDRDQFGQAVVSAIKAMMTQEDQASLDKRWGRFPVDDIAALERALGPR
jgi:hypothetical protein